MQGLELVLATANLHLKVAGTHTLIPNYIGFCTVQANAAKISHRLELSACVSQVCNVFHVSLIKPHKMVAVLNFHLCQK